LLDAYIEGSLRPREARALRAHLGVCPACAGLLQELRVVDALLTTARPPGVAADFTAAVVSAATAAPPHKPRRPSLGLAVLLYLGAVWGLAIFAFARSSDLAGWWGDAVAQSARDAAAFSAAAHALAPATPLAAAAVSGVLLVDLFLLAALIYGYRRFHPALATYLRRGTRP